METRVEQVGGGVEVWVSPQHTFGTDSFLLSHFAQPRRDSKVLDLCTGCGIIPLLWFRGDEGPRTAHALDIQPQALELLEESVALSGLEDRVLPLLGDLRELRGRLPAGSFDLITCNPPYKAAGSGLPSQTDSDRIARHETLCTLKDVCAAARLLLRFGGRLCLCQLPERLVDVMAIMRDQGIEPKRLRLVQQRAEDSPWLVLVEGKRGAKPFLQIDPPLIMRQGDKPTAEMAEIYSDYGRI